MFRNKKNLFTFALRHFVLITVNTQLIVTELHTSDSQSRFTPSLSELLFLSSTGSFPFAWDALCNLIPVVMLQNI